MKVGAAPRLTDKLGLLKEGLESVEAVTRLATLMATLHLKTFEQLIWTTT